MPVTSTSVVALSPQQVKSIRESNGRANLWHGSVRSGKTIASLLRWMIYVAGTSYNGELVVVARTRDSAYRNVFQPMMDAKLFGAASSQIHYTSGAPTAKMFGRVVHVLGASDVKAEKMLRGLTCAGAYVDEVTVIPYEFFSQLLNRLWGLAQLFATTNPDNPVHWLKVNYLDRILDLPGWRDWKFTLKDNPALTLENRQAIERENIGLFYRRYVLGEWVAAEGAVFPDWDQDIHVIPWLQLPQMSQLLSVGIDYGTTNPSAALLLGLGEDDRLYLVDEWRHDPKKANLRLTDAQQSDAIRYWLSSPHLPYITSLTPAWILADPAAASLRTQLFTDGLTTQVAHNDVVSGIQSMSSILSQGQLLVSNRCTGFIQEISGYSWDDKATLLGKDAPIKVADHSMDAARYAIYTTRTLWQGRLALPAAA